MRAEYREEPCRSALNRVRGMPFAWSLNPYMGCVAPLHVLLRQGVRGARRPALRTTATGRASGSRRTSPRCCARELRRPSWERRAGRDRRRDRPVPAGRGPLPADARVHPRALRGGEPVLADHARAARRPRRRRARCEAARRADVSVTFSVPTLDTRDLAADRARHGATRASACARSAALVEAGIARRRRHGADPARALATGRRCSPTSSAPPARPARRGSGRTSSTCARARASTSSAALARDWPELLPRVRAPLRARAPTCPRRRRRRSASTSASCARSHGVRDRRRDAARAGSGTGAATRSPCDCGLWSEYHGTSRMMPIGDHLPDRRRPRGRPRRPAPVALAAPRTSASIGEAAGRRERGRARRAAAARRRDHGRAHARHGRARGDEAADREGAGHGGADLHRVQRAQPAQPRARVGREGLHPQGGAARDAAPGDREGRGRRGLRRPGADARVPDRPRQGRHADRARAGDPAAARRRHVERGRRRPSSSSARRP